MSTFQGKVAFITGASRGIGAAIARELARKGANVVLAAKSIEKHKVLPGTILSVAEEIREIADRHQNGAKALPLQLDVRDANGVEEAIKATSGTFGHLDIVVNNVRVYPLLILGFSHQPFSYHRGGSKGLRPREQHQCARYMARFAICFPLPH